MVVNLPPQYYKKEAELKKAKTLDEKIAILEEMLSIMPKHKSSEKLQALLKSKIAKYKRLKEKLPQTARKQTAPSIKREGAGQIVICGPPNSGKSTLLATLTKAKPLIADYPFTTIEPNLGKGFVRIDCICKDLKVKDNPKNSICINGIRFIPVKLLDVAGLVPDAHKGKGMGNKFLSDLSRADVLIHVIDISGSLDAEGQEIDEGSRDPLEDITFLEREINYWFRDILIRKDWQKFIRKIEQEKLHFADVFFERMAGISVKKDHIILAMKESKLDFEHLTSWNEEDVLLFATKLREISKPIVVVANKIDKPVSEKIFKEISKKIKNFLPCSALAELWLRKYAEKEIIEYLLNSNVFSPDIGIVLLKFHSKSFKIFQKQNQGFNSYVNNILTSNWSNKDLLEAGRIPFLLKELEGITGLGGKSNNIKIDLHVPINLILSELFNFILKIKIKKMNPVFDISDFFDFIFKINEGLVFWKRR